MRYYVVIDTNILVSALLTSNPDSPTVKILKLVSEGILTPLYSEYLLAEYHEVLTRSKFAIPTALCNGIVAMFLEYGMDFEPVLVDLDLPDKDDIPIFLIADQTRDYRTYLVTGNLKHFPEREFVISPKTLVDIIENDVSTQ